MKLEFLKTNMDYYRPILRETRTVEETAEAIVPDSCPDAVEVLHTSGLAFLRGKELSSGLLSLSAGVSATALLAVEGRDTPEVIEVYIPMSLRLEHSQLDHGQNCRVSVQLRRLDGQLVNPRKVMIRATVAICLWVYTQEQQEHLTEVLSTDIQVLKKTAPVRCLMTMGEKSYTVEDIIHVTVPGEFTTMAGCQGVIRHTDARLTGTRAVLRGTVDMEVLLLDQDGSPRVASGQVPFSQYIELGDCQETDELMLDSVLAGADVTLVGEGSLRVTLQLVTTAQVWGRYEMEYLGDIYSLKGTVEGKWAEECYDSLLDRQVFAPMGYGTLEGTIGTALCAFPVCGELSCRREGETVEFTLPVTVHLLYAGENGELRGEKCGVELKASTQATEQCRFEAGVTELSVSCGQNGGLDVKVSGELTVDTFSTLQLEALVAAELTEESRKADGPGLIIRRPVAGESLWELAKAYGTTREAIAQANGLEGESLGDKMLLIPRVR